MTDPGGQCRAVPCRAVEPLSDAQQRLAEDLAHEAARATPPALREWVRAKTSDHRVQGEVERLVAAFPTMAGAPGDLLLGKTLGGFKLTRVIGSGGMGRVYEAVEVEARSGGEARRAAVKVMSRAVATETGLKRFQQEVAILAGLDHPRIARLYASGLWDDGEGSVPWYAMEFVESARDIVHYCDSERVPPKRRMRMLAEVADAIAHAHAKGVVHRDLKPANILVNMSGQARVIDFGIARAEHSAYAAGVRTETGHLVGTLQYMSPEQFQADPRRIDRRVDVYALGVIAYELLTGMLPHELGGIPLHEAGRIVQEKDPTRIDAVLPDIDRALGIAVMACLARNPEERFDGCVALATAIRRALDDAGTSAAPHSPRVPGGASVAPSVARPPGGRGGGGNWMLIGAAAVLMIGGALYMVLRPNWESGNAAGGGAAAGAAAAHTESVQMTSLPEGADVRLDGASIGRTPCRIDVRWTASASPLTLTFQLEGYRAKQAVVTPDPSGARGGNTTVHVDLEPVTAP